MAIPGPSPDERYPLHAIIRGQNGTIVRRDLIAGLTVALFTVPQAMAYALVAGFPPSAGIMTAVVASILGAAFGSSELLVSGPTNAIAVMLAARVALSADLGNPVSRIAHLRRTGHSPLQEPLSAFVAWSLGAAGKRSGRGDKPRPAPAGQHRHPGRLLPGVHRRCGPALHAPGPAAALSHPPVPLIPLLGAACCLYLAAQLPPVNWLRFGLLLGFGLILYVGYSRGRSALTSPSADVATAKPNHCNPKTAAPAMRIRREH